MSGVRRKTKYRKSVEADVLDSLPEPLEDEEIVRVVASRGGNLIEVETVEGVQALCRLPNRYRKVVWVKRGTLLIVGTCKEDFQTANGENGKVKFIVNHVIFTDEQVKNLRKTGKLPSVFDPKDHVTKPTAVAEVSEGEDDSDEDEDNDLPVNNNRRTDLIPSDDDDDDDDDDEDETQQVSEDHIHEEE